ncbi:MAG: MBL fold metallo-hydrolase [Bacteroidales bacterium]|nr:MBL fold metallo-hydrolase [Bacteroidales bacterium]
MSSVKFKSFSSGSCGNCYFLGLFPEEGRRCEAGIIIDAGVSPRRLKKELQSDGLCFEDFSAVLVTHDHLDHIRSLGSFCKHIRKPVWATENLHRALSRHSMTRGQVTDYRMPLLENRWNDVVPGRIKARYFVVPHDASETVGYAILLDDYKFVIMTDIGRMTEEAVNWARQADTVVIESNYDPEMLRTGPYPPDLQKRIRDGHGHLSNPECAQAIKAFNHSGLSHIFLCHLSEHNNTPELAYSESLPFAGSASLAPLPRQTASPLIILRP